MGFADNLQAAFKGGLHMGSDATWHSDFLPCGLPCIDSALGGGVGFGRAIEFIGPYSSGKTLLLYLFLASNQKRGGTSILNECEGAFNPEFYQNMGGDPASLLIIPAEESRTVEGTFDALNKVCDISIKGRAKGDDTPIAWGWDGIAACGTKHLQEVGMDKKDMSKAEAMSRGCQLIADKLGEARVAMMVTNQMREVIGSMSSEPHGPGGKAFPFLSSQRIFVEMDGGYVGSQIKDKDNEELVVGRWTKGQVIKNKLAPPFRKFKVPMYFESGNWHPAGYNYGTKCGICYEEAMFYHYLRVRYLPASKIPIVAMPSNGWYQLSAEFFPNDQEKFHAKDWPDRWNAHESLRTMVFETSS